MDIPTLAQIDKLRLQFDESGNVQALQVALGLITEKTVNVEWYRSTISKLQERGIHLEDRTWIVETIDKYNSKAWVYRDLFHKASETLDGVKIAQAAIDSGIWHIQGGDFRLAKQSFDTAKRSDPTRLLECVYYSMTVDLLRREYSTASSTISKQYKTICDMRDPLAAHVLYTYAVALWKSQNLADCAIVLLNITHHKPDYSQWPWASPSNLAIMCIVGSLLALGNENLFYLVYSDIKAAPYLKQWPYLGDLIRAYMNVDIEQFDKLWINLETEIDEYLSEELKLAHSQLRDALLGTFLALRTECPLDSVLKLFRVRTSLQLAITAIEKKFAIEIDPINKVVRIVPSKPSTGIEREYIQSSVATIWHNTHGSNVNSNRILSESAMRALRGRDRQWGFSGTATPPIRPAAAADQS